MSKFHWQSLNEGGSGLRKGRCWWGPLRLEWSLLSRHFGLGIDADDEDATLFAALPPVSLWLSVDSRSWIIKKLWPHKVLSPTYPDTIVIEDRECSIRIHDWVLWINPWSKKNETCYADPWWVRGVAFHFNPFELKHFSHEVKNPEGAWVPYVGSWEKDKSPDGRAVEEYPYLYVLKSGEVQNRTAKIYVERMKWRPRCLFRTRLLEKTRESISVEFNDEVGERTGSWKGGTIGCSWELLKGESPQQALRRMEAERKF